MLKKEEICLKSNQADLVLASHPSGVFIILIILTSLFGCASHTSGPVPVRDAVSHTPSIVSAPAAAYRVQAGDTLFSIAWRNNTTVEALQRINGLAPGAILRIGQSLQLAEDVGTRTAAKPAAKAPATEPKMPEADSSPDCCVKKQTNTEKLVVKYESSPGSKDWIWPVKGRVISGYQSKGGLNKGIDIQSKLGEPVLAASDGEVVFAGAGLKDYANLVIIKHGSRYLSAYSNNQLLLVKEGQRVRRGQVIARVGKGPQGASLHFEIRLDGKPLDPLKHLPTP
jgi:lipoprotein NlpD